MTTIRPATVAAYKGARYRIEPLDAPAIELRVGQHSAELADLYRELGASTCAYLTACNPGAVLSDASTAAAMSALHADLLALGFPQLDGIRKNGDPASDWYDEASIAAFGVSRETASDLGQSYRQDAIVWAGPDAVPRPVLLR